MNHVKPALTITMGDPAGVGAEIILKAFSSKYFFDKYKCLVVGEATVLRRYKNMLKINAPDIKIVENTDGYEDGKICVLDIPVVGDDFPVGEVSAKCGGAAFKYIDYAINAAKRGETDAIITCPINKEALHLAGYDYPGHTEIFAEKCGVKNFSMLFKLGKVSVIHCTTHCSLRDAISQITCENVRRNIVLLHGALKDFGIQNPRIAVAGLNPHAGENGLFGTEEIEHIIPALEWARANGIDARGVFPPDTVFCSAFKGEFDGVVSMLHDHGFVALKSRDFESGVNITVGLPVIRTSVGHGTAFDIAGKNLASANSLLCALDDAHTAALNKIGGGK